MGSGNLISCICDRGFVPLASVFTPSTSRLRFFIEKLQLPPNATEPSHIFISISQSSCLRALGSRAESPFSFNALDAEKHMTISYLVTTCGLSRQTALRATKFVSSKNRKRAITTVQLLRSYGFSDAQIDKIVAKEPCLLVCTSEKIIKPKLDFLLSKGFSIEEVVDIFAANSSILRRNLERGLMATYSFLSATLPSRSDVIKALKCGYQYITVDHEPNIKMLRDNGVSESVIFYLVERFPTTLRRRFEHLEEAVKTLLEMGMDPKTKMFGRALCVLSCLSKESWLMKSKLFQELGLSETKVIRLFMRRPTLFSLTVEKFRYKVNFFKNSIGCDHEFLSKSPELLQLSIEGRISPRVSILKVLMSHGLIKKKWSPALFNYSEKQFYERFVNRYKVEVPDILNMHKDYIALKEN